MNEEQLTKENQNSIAVKRNAKGDYAWDIKIYFDDNDDSTVNRIKDLDDKLKTKFSGQ